MLINRNFTRLWLGQSVSVIGDEVFETTLLLWVGVILLAGRSYAPAVSSGVLVITSLVVIGLGPLAGVFVDRWDKKRTLLRADLIRAVLIGALALISFFPSALPLPATLVVIGTVVAVSTAASQFFNPARTIIIRDVVPEEQLGRATGYGQTAAALAGVIGPPLAAPLLIGAGVSWAIAVNAVSFLVSYLAIRSVRLTPAPARVSEPEPVAVPAMVATGHPPVETVPAPESAVEPASVRREFMAGWRFIRRSRLVVATLVTAIVINLGLGAVLALTVYFVGENLHADPKWYGLLGGAFSIGLVVGALGGGFLGDRLGHVRVVTAGLIAAGVLIMVLSRAESVAVAAPVFTAFGLAIGALNAAITPVVIKAVPREFLGRVFAVIQPANRLGGLFSIVIASVLVSTVLRNLNVTVAGVHLGRIDSIFLVAGLITISSGVYFGLAAREPASG